MAKRNTKQSLISLSVEHISGELFFKYSDAITKLIEKSAGIYALYNKDKLYYVGRATNLKRRVKQHLNDKHKKKWTHFSLFLINLEDHIGELESLLVRIADPRGNVVKPKGKDTRGRKLLEKIIRDSQREERVKLLHGSRERKVKLVKEKTRTIKKGNRSRGLKDLVTKRVTVQRTYKGIKYVGKLTPSGFIIYKNKKYSTPTAAAKAITKRTAINGWYFWCIKNKKGELVQLRHY